MTKAFTTRRKFIKSAATAAAALGASRWTAKSWAQVAGSNEAVRIAVLGLHNRGLDHLGEIKKVPGFRLVGLCDPDQAVLDGHNIKNQKLPDVPKYQDLRKLLEDKNLDAVSIATPNHWHALAAIWAIQAGKDVYVEKPVSHNISEGRRIVEFARKHERIVQAGTQMRSSIEGIKQAVEYVQSGKLGKIKVARALNYKRRPSIGKVTEPQQPPPTVDLDIWTGPAEKLPIMRKQFHYDWHWQWNTGDGDIGNQGIHEMDVARWFLGATDISPMVLTVGGRVGYVDDGQTPNSVVLMHDYPQAPMIFEVRGLPDKTDSKKMDAYKDVAIGVVVECEGGYVTVPNYSLAQVFDNDGKKITEFRGIESHFANFLTAIKSRKSEDLHADILQGHISTALCHLGNISYRVGQQTDPQSIAEQIKSDSALAESYHRMSEHLQANGLDLTQEKLTLGQPLKFDAKTEMFIDGGSEEANKYLTRTYREPFVVPASVS